MFLGVPKRENEYGGSHKELQLTKKKKKKLKKKKLLVWEFTEVDQVEPKLIRGIYSFDY